MKNAKERKKKRRWNRPGLRRRLSRPRLSVPERINNVALRVSRSYFAAPMVPQFLKGIPCKFDAFSTPTDFSEATKVAATSACEMADKFEAELHVLHVLHDLSSLMPFTAISLWTEPEHIAEIADNAKRILAEIPDADWSQGRAVVRKVSVGNVADEITAYARQHGIDLIVIGTHGHAGLKHAVLGSIAEKVVRTAECPVLSIRLRETAVVTNALLSPMPLMLD